MAGVKRHIGRKIFFAIILAIAILVLAYFIRAQFNSYTPKDGYSSYEWSENMQFDLSLFEGENLYIDDDSEQLKIMQLADPQIKLGFMTSDTKTFDLIDRALKAEKPDIAVVTGDLTLSIFTYDAYKYFADFMEERQQYWTLVWGNHDAEYDASKYVLANLLDGYEYCLFNPGPSNVKGESNFLINVFKGDATVPSYSLVMLDSGMYPDGKEEGILGDWVYDWIGEDQVAWYEWAIKGLKTLNPDIKSSVYFHIPTREFADMYYKNLADNGEIDTTFIDTTDLYEVREYEGNVCEGSKSTAELIDAGYEIGIYYQGKNTGIYEKIRELGSSNAIFCGHDHVNTVRGYYGDIYLGYGLCCGYHTYPFFEENNFLLDLFGLSGKVLFNGDLWVDQNGEKMEKGVTVIEVSLKDGELGNLNVTNYKSSELGG